MKKLLCILLLFGATFDGFPKGTNTIDSLNRIINGVQNSPEIRIDACVYQGEYYINKSGGAPKDIDSAAASLKHGEQLSKAFKLQATDGELLFLRALISKKKGNRVDGDRLNDLALTLLREKPGNHFLGEALLEKGDYLNIGDGKQCNEKIALRKEALPCFSEMKYAGTRAAIWKSIGDLYQLHSEVSGNLGLAIEAYQRSMDIYFSYGYRNVQDIYIEMGEIYRYLGDNEQGLRFCLLAVQTGERARDTSFTMCQIYNYTGMQYSALLDYAQAKKYFTSALKIAEKFNNQEGMFNIASNLNLCYREDKEYSKIKDVIDRMHEHFPENDLRYQHWSKLWYLLYYTLTKDAVNGNKYCQQLIKLLNNPQSFPVHNGARNTYVGIAGYYTMTHDFKKAYEYWDKAYSLIMQYNNNPENRNKLIYMHYTIDTASHNLSSAISFLERYTKLRDSMFTISKAQQEANLQVVYDTQKKEYELADSRQKIKILTQNQQLQQANLKQAFLIRNITIGFTFIVIVVSLLLYRMVRLNKKAVKKIARTNSLLEKLVSEKEWLLKEVHHRVKNNLHTVICLLESQAAYLEEDALKAIDNSRHRIYAMSLIHEKLYENENVKVIDMNNYVTSLVEYLRDSFDLKSNIIFRLEIAPVLIDTSIAIPIGLIINEAVTNSIKYAFIKKDSGEITIQLYEADEKIVVIVADDGVGMDMLHTQSHSMGLRLMKGLSGDIGGKILFNNHEGTEIRLTCARVLLDDEEINLEELLNNIQDGVES